MDYQIKTNKTDIVVSSDIDDLIFMSEPKDLTFEEQEQIRDKLVRESYKYHYNNNEAYRKYVNAHGIDQNISSIDDIPVFPTSVFKYFKLHSLEESEIENWYTSSGTSGMKSFIARDRLSIERLLGSVRFGLKYIGDWYEHELELINLGPDRFNSNNIWFEYVMSLVELLFPTSFTVCDGEIDFEGTIAHLKRIAKTEKHTCIIGPPYFIFLLCEYMNNNNIHFEGKDRLSIITGGGWKMNQNKSLNRSDFNKLVLDTFNLSDSNQIRDTFNQVELNTCFFEDEHHRKHVPPWVYARALDPVNLKPVSDGQEGLLSYMDASSMAYPAFIVTDDIGIVRQIKSPDKYQGTTIEIIRRVSTRAQKGCALSMANAMK